MCKYKELYDISVQVLGEEQQRFNRMDEKAVKYFSVISFLIGVCVFFGKQLIADNIPPANYSEWTILIFGSVSFLSLFLAWIFCFLAIKQHVIEKMPLNDDMIKFFHENRLIDIHYALTKANKKALAINRKKTDKKSKLLANAYRSILVSVITLVFFVILWSGSKWHNAYESKFISKGDCIMTEEKKEEQKPKEDVVAPNYDRLTANDQKPKEDVVAPNYDQITEGYDPVTKKNIEKGVIDKNDTSK